MKTGHTTTRSPLPMRWDMEQTPDGWALKERQFYNSQELFHTSLMDLMNSLQRDVHALGRHMQEHIKLQRDILHVHQQRNAILSQIFLCMNQNMQQHESCMLELLNVIIEATDVLSSPHKQSCARTPLITASTPPPSPPSCEGRASAGRAPSLPPTPAKRGKL
ncbi:hypothetical protein FKM82_027633 [Ascaphus truei]